MEHKERPILFNGEMVRAIIDGRKTQTRRIVKSIPELGICSNLMLPSLGKAEYQNYIGDYRRFCPYGQPEDKLWVRETFHHDKDHNRYFYRANVDTNGSVPYLLNGDGGFGGGVGHAWVGKWKPSIHMPRKASRITLEITDVRIERLNDISDKDALSEGISIETECIRECNYSPKEAYARLWESINGSGSWAANPFVWVVSFRMINQ